MYATKNFAAFCAAAALSLPAMIEAHQQHDGVQVAAMPLAMRDSTEVCTTKCVRSNGCSPDDNACMCEASQNDFLSSMVTCMYQYCSGGLPYDSFADPLIASCKSMGQPIPQSSQDDAEKLLSYVANPKQPSETTTSSTQQQQPQPTETTTSSKEDTAPAPTTTANTASTTLQSAPTQTKNNNGNTDTAPAPTSTKGGATEETSATWGPTMTLKTSTGTALETAPTNDSNSGKNNSNNNSNQSNAQTSNSPSNSNSTTDDDEGTGNREQASFFAIALGLGAAVVMSL